jgi:hypothetical protein
METLLKMLVGTGCAQTEGNMNHSVYKVVMKNENATDFLENEK